MRIYHSVCFQIGGCDILSRLERLLANNLHPVSIRVKRKGNVLHPSVCQLFLELVTCVLDSLARGLDIVHTNTGMSKAPEWF